MLARMNRDQVNFRPSPVWVAVGALLAYVLCCVLLLSA